MLKKYTLLFLALLFAFYSHSQTNYQAGQIILNSGDTLNCFIDNVGWKFNPDFINVKTDTEDAPKRYNVNTIKGFKIGNLIRYEVATVELDISTDRLAGLGISREPDFELKKLFLKVLIEGDASLYSYKKNNLTRFFYRLDKGQIYMPFEGQIIKPLVYKRYMKEGKVTSNENYKRSLFLDFKDCDELSQQKFEGLNYKEKSLSDLFVAYNSCKNADYQALTTETKKKTFSAKLKAGAVFASYSVDNANVPTLAADFGSRVGYRFALEGEIYPLNKTNFSLFAEFAKQADYEETVTIQTSVPGTTQEVTFTLKTFELSAGFKYYVLNNEDSRFALGAGYTYNGAQESSLTYERSPDFNNDRRFNHFFIGGSYQYNKLGLEARLSLGKDAFKGVSAFSSDLNELILVVFYELF